MAIAVGARERDIASTLLQAVAGEDDEIASARAWQLVVLVSSRVLSRAFGSLHRSAFYLPADRTGVMHAHRIVVSALIKSAARTGLRPDAGMPMLSGVLADFLSQLIEIDSPSYRTETYRDDLGTSIEEAILRGAIRIERSEATGYPHFTYRPAGWKTDLPGC